MRSWRLVPAFAVLLLCVAISGSSVGATSPTVVRSCGHTLCIGSKSWYFYGASVYNPGLTPIQSGIKDPDGTIQLAQQARLNTIRLINFYSDAGNPQTLPYNPTVWKRVDAMIAAARSVGMRIALGLSDYRNILWNSCINPYTHDWNPFLKFVASRVNTVTHLIYKDDPTIAFVSISGEPLPVGAHRFTARTTGASCTLTYSTHDLTNFFAQTTAAWKQTGASVLVNSGGLGYLDFASGIDWKAIFRLSTNDFCDIKTYGGMLAYASTPAQFCHTIHKPILDEEFGWQQDATDATRTASFDQTYARVKALGFSGAAFWNLGYQLAGTSYDVNPNTPLTFAAVQQHAP
jgi:hypothetical protein